MKIKIYEFPKHVGGVCKVEGDYYAIPDDQTTGHCGFVNKPKGERFLDGYTYHGPFQLIVEEDDPANTGFSLTANEIEFASESPAVLREIAEYHDIQATMGEAMDYDCSGNEKRRLELLSRATEIEERIEREA